MSHVLSAEDQAMTNAVGAASSTVGAIVGIVLAIIIGCPLGCLLIFCLLSRSKQTGAQQLIHTPQNVTVEMSSGHSGSPVTTKQV